MTPATTAFAKSYLTVTNDTRKMTAASNFGILLIMRSDDQLNVDIHTVNITPTKAAIGTDASNGAPTTMPNARNNDIPIPDKRLFNPPLSAQIIDWPRRAHPPIPPAKPLAMLPNPCPKHSFFVDPRLPSSAIPSNSCMVNKDSIAPTAAIVIAKGATILSVSRVNGTAGRDNVGSTERPPRNVSAPLTSLKVFTGNFKSFAAMAQIETAPRVGGTTLNPLIFGIVRTKSIVKAVSPYIDFPAGEDSERKDPAALLK
mmetsp:Transcript_1320/g.2056  ORF Transcript_1320/g.2056 Transcript_1320/m.2056 type:complete len:257 (-) Transcript_1320:748-1518(-)